MGSMEQCQVANEEAKGEHATENPFNITIALSALRPRLAHLSSLCTQVSPPRLLHTIVRVLQT